MNFIFYFHIKSPDINLLVHLLEKFTGIHPEKAGEAISDLQDTILCDTEADPDYYVLGKGLTGWCHVEVNSFKKLHELGVFLSKEMNTLFVQTSYCATEQYVYFLVYNCGFFLEESECLRRMLHQNFRKEEIQSLEKADAKDRSQESTKYLDFDSLVECSRKFGFDLTELPTEGNRVIFTNPTNRGKLLYNVITAKQRCWNSFEEKVLLLPGDCAAQQ